MAGRTFRYKVLRNEQKTRVIVIFKHFVKTAFCVSYSPKEFYLFPSLFTDAVSR
jgi:hypothetical protein